MHPERAMAPLTVYFDGSCPLCRREIAWYQRLPQLQPIAWVDVSRPADCGSDLSCDVAMRRFHVRDPQGRLLSGARAFAALWCRLKGWRWLGLVASVPPVSWVAELAYRAFLPLRPRLQSWVSRRSHGS